MAKKDTAIPQNYPRIDDSTSKFYGLLDDSKLLQHKDKLSEEIIRELVKRAIQNANVKSSRVILNIDEKLGTEEISTQLKSEGRKLFKYFRKYCGDPASTAYDLIKKHYIEVCKNQFRVRTLQKERMNSGWRYQFLARECAHHSKRFVSVSDIGAAEADFNAIIKFMNEIKEPLSLYVSIKNRVNTMGGQDWPKAIFALEKIAQLDKNRTGPYCCVFGMTMDRGSRYMKVEQKTSQLYSVNTEIWLSDFFWPFFSNYSFEEIMKIVLDTLIYMKESQADLSIEIPIELIEEFGQCCIENELLDSDGYFNDPYKLVYFFCTK